MAAVPDADTECREEASSAHSSCAGSLAMADTQPELVGLMERQNWLLEAEMSKLAWKGSLSALQCHLAYACDDFWQTHWVR